MHVKDQSCLSFKALIFPFTTKYTANDHYDASCLLVTISHRMPLVKSISFFLSCSLPLFSMTIAKEVKFNML